MPRRPPCGAKLAGPDLRALRYAVFPIFPMRHVTHASSRKLLRGDPHEQGTAFIISPDGIFLTARHVVDHDDADKLSIAAFNIKSRRYAFCAVKTLETHAQFDVAIGSIGPPNERELWPHKLALGGSSIAPGAAIYVYGFQGTRIEERELPATSELGLGLAYFNALCPGTVTDYYPNGITLGKEPAYAHTADTLSGISGGPFIRKRTMAVHGVTRSGEKCFGVATDVRAILNDWAYRVSRWLHDPRVRTRAIEQYRDPMNAR